MNENDVLFQKAFSFIHQAGNIPSHLFHIPRVSTFKSQQYAGCLSHEPSLMALAPTSLLQLSGRASELVIGRSQVRLLIGALGFFSEYACVTFWNNTSFSFIHQAGNIPSHLFHIPRVSTFKSQQYAGCLSHEPSLMALAPTSLLQLSGRASELVIGRSQVRLLIGALGFFSEYACVTFWNNTSFSFIHQAGNIPSHLFHIPRVSTFKSQQYAGCLSHEPSLVALAPTSLLQLSGRASELVIGRSQVRLLIGALGFFSAYACVTFWNNTSFSFIHQAGNIPSHLFHIPRVSTFKSQQYAGCLSHEPSLMALAPTSLLQLSGRASELVIGRSQVRLLIGALGFFSEYACVTFWNNTSFSFIHQAGNIPSHLFHIPRVSTFKSQQYAGCLSHEPSLMALAPTSLLQLSGRASELVIGRSQVRLLIGALGFFSEYACVTFWNNTSFSFIHQAGNIPSHLFHIPRVSTFKSQQYAGCLSHEPSLMALAPTSLLQLSGRASELVIGRSQVRLLIGALGFFSEYACVTFWNNTSFSFIHQAGNIPSHLFHIPRVSTFKSQQYAGCLSHEPSLMALAPTSLLQLSGRASELVIGRSQVRLLIGALGFFFRVCLCHFLE